MIPWSAWWFGYKFVKPKRLSSLSLYVHGRNETQTHMKSISSNTAAGRVSSLRPDWRPLKSSMTWSWWSMKNIAAHRHRAGYLSMQLSAANSGRKTITFTFSRKQHFPSFVNQNLQHSEYLDHMWAVKSLKGCSLCCHSTVNLHLADYATQHVWSAPPSKCSPFTFSLGSLSLSLSETHHLFKSVEWRERQRLGLYWMFTRIAAIHR